MPIKTHTNKPPKKPTLLILLLIIGSGFIFHKAYQANSTLTPVLPALAAQETMQHWFNGPTDKLQEKAPISHLETLKAIYRNADYKMLWFNGYTLNQTGEQLIQQLLESSADELFDYQYHLAYIQQRLHKVQTLPKDITALDVLMTDAFVAYILDIVTGKMSVTGHTENNTTLKRVSLSPQVNTQKLSADQHNNIIQLLKDNNQPHQLAEVLNSLTPQHEEYLRLRSAFNQYQKLVSDNQWGSINSGPSLKLGDNHPQVATLRSKLIQTGDLTAKHYFFENVLGSNSSLNTSSNTLFDVDLDLALRRFQTRHGTKVDGVLGRGSRELLNITPNFRVRQIALNMKRWRELPRELGERYIWVNMTDYTLQLVNQGEVELDMRVIIGKEYRRTPVMSENIRSIVLNPHWNVPRRIALNDILPQIKQDPTYLKERRFNVFSNWTDKTPVDTSAINWAQMSKRHFPYRLQQRPGKGNALGRIKFVIPNDQSIYLHDTSSPGLFDRQKRTLSSGCVRVEKPFALAQALMKGSDNWNPNRLQQTLNTQKTRYIKLPKPVPTYLFYQTVWVDDHNTLHFRDDIYQGDEVVHSRLKQAISL